jgi:hypothetical protein
VAFRAITVAPPEPGKKRWRVLVDGRQVSRHNSKSNAKQKAKSVADEQDTVSVMGRDGRFQDILGR